MNQFNKLTIFCLLLVSSLTTKIHPKIYTDQYVASVRVPIGGIGTGDVLMGGRGNIEFIEIFNQPDRHRRLEKTFFALWYKQGEQPPVTKILERELFPPFQESTHKYVAGLPRIRNVNFTNSFPLFFWNFSDPDIPIKISLEAFCPFIPLDVEKSSYPILAYYWQFTNTTSESIKGSLVLNMENPIKGTKISNSFFENNEVQGIHFVADKAADINYQGGLILATPCKNVDVQTHWYPGQWRDETHIFWDDFSYNGSIESKLESWQTTFRPTSYNQTTKRMASLLVHFDLEPGQIIRIPFYLSWYFPNRKFEPSEVFGIQEAADKTFANFYSRLFKNECDVLSQFLENEENLYKYTAQFAQNIIDSSFPQYVKEALTTQAASLRTHLLQVTADGDVHGFEGVLDDGWCCPGTCTHVWNYEQTLASLFPSLERSMREIEFLHDTFDNGFQTHRSVLPLGDYWFDGPAAADGQMGAIIRAFREWKMSGDTAWLKKMWPGIVRALEFAWTGPGKVEEERFKYQERQAPWDPQKSGILSGRQHNTYDINFFGPSSMTTSLYLAALKAGSIMAETLGDSKRIEEYYNVYQNGVHILEDSLWNGKYFIQLITQNPNLETETESESSKLLLSKLPKYQYGDGCLSDQLLGQYMAFNAGLGAIIDSSKMKKAIKAIYDYNFIRVLRSFANVQRVYGLNDEAGVVLCTWPNGNRPALPFVYSDEIWSGVEFQVASSLIYCGFVQEGLEIVKAVQDRYDGYKRNPFEHDESGVHYARALSSWSLLLALSGFEYDGVNKTMTFKPRINGENFFSFWSTGNAWGHLKIDKDQVILAVDYGELALIQFTVSHKISKSYKNTRNLAAGEQLVFSFE